MYMYTASRTSVHIYTLLRYMNPILYVCVVWPPAHIAADYRPRWTQLSLPSFLPSFQPTNPLFGSSFERSEARVARLGSASRRARRGRGWLWWWSRERASCSAADEASTAPAHLADLFAHRYSRYTMCAAISHIGHIWCMG